MKPVLPTLIAIACAAVLAAQAPQNTIAALAAIRPDRPVHVSAGYGWRVDEQGAAPQPTIWVAADVDLQAWRRMPWSSGGNAWISVVSGDDTVVAAERELPALSPRLLLWMTETRLAPGDYDVRVKVQPKLGTTEDFTATLHVQIPRFETNRALLAAPVLLFRRGPYTGAGFQPTADIRFRKSERLRADVPVAAGEVVINARLLDRRGQPLPIPVDAAAREENGFRFASAEITLAPLAQGDYLLELARGSGANVENKLVAFRIVP